MSNVVTPTNKDHYANTPSLAPDLHEAPAMLQLRHVDLAELRRRYNRGYRRRTVELHGCYHRDTNHPALVSALALSPLRGWRLSYL
jgi:hypothetical protein